MTETDKARLRRRHEAYLTNHYLALHNMVVSVALAVAGVAAASLLGLPPAFHDFAPLLWMMLVVSLLAVAVAYAGTATGAPSLPAGLPALPDLVLPLLLAVSEFFLFGVLAHQVNSLTSPQATVRAWFFAVGCFGVFAALSVARARSLVRHGDYSVDLYDAMRQYTRRLGVDAVAAAFLAVIGFAAAIFVPLAHGRPAVWEYIAVGFLAVQCFAGFASHAYTRGRLMEALG